VAAAGVAALEVGVQHSISAGLFVRNGTKAYGRMSSDLALRPTWDLRRIPAGFSPSGRRGGDSCSLLEFVGRYRYEVTKMVPWPNLPTRLSVFNSAGVDP
jgi:hypothetical protein